MQITPILHTVYGEKVVQIHNFTIAQFVRRRERKFQDLTNSMDYGTRRFNAALKMAFQ